MSLPVPPSAPGASRGADAGSGPREETAPRSAATTSVITASLRSRIRQLEAAHLASQRFPVPEALGSLLPQGLLAGSSYAVLGSTTLALSLIARASAGGAWCGVLGTPDLGTEAAASLGIDLQRLILVPSAGQQWAAVAAAMIDVLSVVVAVPPASIPAGDVARLNARLRQRRATMITLGPWPQAEATLRVTGSRWSGLGTGHGYLTGRNLLVEVLDRRAGGRRRTGEVDLGGPSRPGLALVPGIGGLHSGGSGTGGPDPSTPDPAAGGPGRSATAGGPWEHRASRAG
ncbi:hypothetical protein GCM10011512_22240 [Tersicoccus solisilvae]|uniref:Recombinase A n=1 Tax=Tersicoccus solisilvae TaxID=1882339 RepID=A0ABQ1PD00_9MICC|nr:hypothetical protein [Tersicoccus solisilvae]GGC94764.1 hypothetical protein GCM10011512_22240 [Tersicoccus solisilvae]